MKQKYHSEDGSNQKCPTWKPMAENEPPTIEWPPNKKGDSKRLHPRGLQEVKSSQVKCPTRGDEVRVRCMLIEKFIVVSTLCLCLSCCLLLV